MPIKPKKKRPAAAADERAELLRKLSPYTAAELKEHDRAYAENKLPGLRQLLVETHAAGRFFLAGGDTEKAQESLRIAHQVELSIVLLEKRLKEGS